MLFAYGLWKIPYVRWFGLGLNLAMIAATPIQGSHYLVDVLAGMSIAALSIFICSCAMTFAGKF
jgi:membrane-associated phospholipid phosphatase